MKAQEILTISREKELAELRSKLAAVQDERDRLRNASSHLVQIEHPERRKKCGYCGEVNHHSHPFCPVKLAEEALAAAKEPSP